MKTLRQFNQHPVSLPSTTGWHLADLGEARGKQELFTRQSLQKLKALREHALIESVVSSNRVSAFYLVLEAWKNERGEGEELYNKPFNIQEGLLSEDDLGLIADLVWPETES
jgi:hypothetical protein